MARDRGMLRLVVTRMSRESEGIVSIELAAATGRLLPAWEPGAHIDVQLITRMQRQYSLCGDPADLRSYRIAVLREDFSRGVSMYVHDFLHVGSVVHVRPPRNLFPVVPASEYLLLAAGIGITPLLPMACSLSRSRAPWAMNYAVRDEANLPFASELESLGPAVTINAPGRAGRLDLDALLATPHPGLAVYACGPARFIDGVVDAMGHWPSGSLHLERFEPKPVAALPNAAFTVHCARSNLDVEVPAERTMLQALTDADLPVTGSCLRGVCGSCAASVLDGEVEHRDSLTTDPDSRVMYPCVSRARAARLTIDV